MSAGPPDLEYRTPHDEPMDFVLAFLTPAENAELRAMCYIAGVRLRSMAANGFRDVQEFMVIGPTGHRTYMLKDMHPLSIESFRHVIRHGTEIIS